MKLFTQEINKKLFAQYSKGSDLSNQMVVAKIFNPYGRGTWYLINSDEDDPDYLWAIVDLFEVEVGSVSRKELESIKIKPFNFGLERDLSFSPKNAEEVFKGLLSGKTYAKGGKLKYDPTRDVVAIAVKDKVFNVMFSKGDFLGGAYQMESGGALKDYQYVSPRYIIFARLKSGEDIKPVNGFYIRKGAKGRVMNAEESKPLKKASVKSLKISIPRPILLTGSPSKSPKMMKFIGTFSGNYYYNPAMTFVQVKEGSIVATDAHKLIRITDGSTLKEDKLVCESTKCKNEKPDDQKFPNANSVLDSIDSEFSESYDMVDLYELLMQVRNDDLKNKVSKMGRVIELKLENQTIYFNITLLLQCVKGCLLLGWKKAFISYRQPDKAVLFTEDKAEGEVREVSLICLMPTFVDVLMKKVTITPKILLEQGGMMGEGGKTKVRLAEYLVTLTDEDGYDDDVVVMAKDEDDAIYKAEQLRGYESEETGVIMLTDFDGKKIEFKKGGEVKVGDILTATTGVKVQVVQYDPKFGGRVRVERMDEYATGKPSQFMSLKRFKMADGGMMGEGPETMIQPTILQNNPNNLVGTTSMYEMFEDGGTMDVVNTEVIKVKGNIMGTTSLELKIKGMRKPQDFIVYPISNDQSGKPITIQSSSRFGYLDLSSGRGLMSQSHANGAYSYHFATDKKVPFKISETDVERIKEHLASKASPNAGNSVIFSDNSGAGIMAKGGEIKNQYEGREAEDIWSNLTKDQRYNFLSDHAEQIEGLKFDFKRELSGGEIRTFQYSSWRDLDKDVKNRFENHVRQGQYADGGVIPYTRNFLKGMQSIKVNGLGGYMPGVRNIYWDVKDRRFYFRDFSGDYIFEIRNSGTLKEIYSFLMKSKISLDKMADGGMMAKGGKIGEDLENYSNYDEFYNVVFDYIKREENLTEEEAKDICIVNESIIEAEFEGGSSPRFTGDVVLDYLSNEKGYMKKGGEIADIQKIKKSLTAKAKQKGIYENFGQKELRQLEDKYGYTVEVQKFDNWATNFDLSELADGGMMAKGGSTNKFYVEQDSKGYIEQGFWGVIDREEKRLIDIFTFKNEATRFAKQLNETGKANPEDFNGMIQYYANGGMMAKGGRLLTTRERYILELKGLADGLRPEAIDKFIDDNDLTNDEILNIIVGLGRKQISSSDFVTALVDNKNNQKFKNLMAFIKSDKAMRLVDGGMMAKGGKIDNYRIVPYKRLGIKGGPDLVTPDYSLAFTTESSLSDANAMAQKYVIENELVSATLTKIHSSGNPLKNKKVSYVTKDEILKYADGGMTSSIKVQNIKERLEELRTELRAEKISYGELVELQSYSDYIDKDDIELLEAAGVSEFDDDEMVDGGMMDLAVVNPDELYKRLNEAEKNFQKDNGAEYKMVLKEIEDNRIFYFQKLSEAERNYLKDNGVEYKRLISMQNKFADGGMTSSNKVQNIKERLEELRTELRAEKISYGELVELQSYSDYIDKDDIELLEAAGVSEFDDDEMADGGITPNKPSRKMSAMMDALGVGSTKNEKPMTKKPYMKPITINLLGPEGNAYYLIGTARRLSKQLGLDGDEITKQMMSGDYENLLEVFESNFGDFVTLVR